MGISTYAFESDSRPGAAGAGAVEHLEHEIDLLGNLVLRSRELGATLQFSRADDGFTGFDPLGSRRSVLHLLRAALPRVPFDGAATLRWSDHLPARWTGASSLGPLRDVLAPFLPRTGSTLDYRAERKGDRLVVRGASREMRDGAPLVRTEAILTRARGLVALLVVAGETRHAAVRREDGAHAHAQDHEHEHEREHARAAEGRWLERLFALRLELSPLLARVSRSFAKPAPTRSGELP